MIILRNKEFARRDYEGLNEVEKKILKNKRSDYAKGLRKAYRSSMNGINQLDPYSEGMRSTLKIKGGGIESNVTQTTNRGLFGRGPITEFHKNGVRDTLINKTLPEAKQLLRENSVREAKQIAESGNKRGKEAVAKRDLQIRQENSKLRNEFRNRVKEYKEKRAKKVAESRASIAKHEARVAELRAKKAMFKNLKTAGKVGLGAAALVGSGVVAKKIYDKKKKDDDNIKG